MSIKIIEFKASAKNLTVLENKLKKLNPDFIGEDHQLDTYFNIEYGRLKLREGNIENALIFYERDNIAEAKQSKVLLYKHYPNNDLKTILGKIHGIKSVVNKIRRIYFIENVKFHFDTVKGLGEFLEVEAIDNNGEIPIEKLTEQCKYYAEHFNISKEDYVAISYSDMVISEK